GGVKLTAEVEFVNFPVVEQQAPLGIEQHGGVVKAVTRPLDDTSADEDAMPARGGNQSLAGFTFRDARRQSTRRRLSPAEVEAFGQQHDLCAARRRLTNALLRAREIGRRLTRFDEHLR